MNLKPVIGITVESKHDPEDARTRGNMELHWNYAQAIADAGGVPLVIPPMADMRQVVGLIDGWLIPGGLDIDASNFGEENHPEAVLQDPSRFMGEKALYEQAPKEMPVLGICYGCQCLNVLRGGNLIQHLPDLPGIEVHTDGPMQGYEVENDSKLSQVVGDSKIEGKSYHHQAVNHAGKDLRVVAKAEDGTIEALEATDRPWMIGVQWHPERTPESHSSKSLFKGFVDAAADYAKSKNGKQ